MAEKETGVIPMEKCPVITISREFGALGRTLARELSERLGIPYYDKDFVTKTAEKSGYAAEEVREEGEELSTPTRMLNNILNSAVSFSSSYDAIFKAQKKVVLDLADNPCIIVGRCADHILREAGKDVFCIYLYAPVKNRVKHTEELGEHGKLNIDTYIEKYIEKHGNKDKELDAKGKLNIEKYIEKYFEKRDSNRRNYYKHYTGHEMGNASNYDICFDTGRIDISTVADIVIEILSKEQ